MLCLSMQGKNFFSPNHLQHLYSKIFKCNLKIYPLLIMLLWSKWSFPDLSVGKHEDVFETSNKLTNLPECSGIFPPEEWFQFRRWWFIRQNPYTFKIHDDIFHNKNVKILVAYSMCIVPKIVYQHQWQFCSQVSTLFTHFFFCVKVHLAFLAKRQMSRHSCYTKITLFETFGV